MISDIKEVANDIVTTTFSQIPMLAHLDIQKIQFRVSKAFISTLGRFQWGRGRQVLTVAETVLVSDEDLRSTLTHELIHAAEYQIYGMASHGMWFKKAARAVMAKNPNIRVSRTSKASEMVAEKVAEKRQKKLELRYFYAIVHAGKVNFVLTTCKLPSSEIATYARKLVRIYELPVDVSKVTVIRKSRSILTALNAKYYYPKKVLETLFGLTID